MHVAQSVLPGAPRHRVCAVHADDRFLPEPRRSANAASPDRPPAGKAEYGNMVKSRQRDRHSSIGGDHRKTQEQHESDDGREAAACGLELSECHFTRMSVFSRAISASQPGVRASAWRRFPGAGKEIAALARCRCLRSKSMSMVAVVHVFPLAVAHGPLLAVAAVDTPEQRAVVRGLFAGEHRQQIDAVAAGSRRRASRRRRRGRSP